MFANDPYPTSASIILDSQSPSRGGSQVDFILQSRRREGIGFCDDLIVTSWAVEWNSRTFCVFQWFIPKTVPYQRLSINGWRTSWLGSVAAEDQGLGYAWSMRVCVFLSPLFQSPLVEALPLCFVQMAQQWRTWHIKFWDLSLSLKLSAVKSSRMTQVQAPNGGKYAFSTKAPQLPFHRAEFCLKVGGHKSQIPYDRPWLPPLEPQQNLHVAFIRFSRPANLQLWGLGVPEWAGIPPNPTVEHQFLWFNSQKIGVYSQSERVCRNTTIKQRNQSFQASNTPPRYFHLEIPGSLAVLMVRHCPAQVPFVPKPHIISWNVRFRVIHSPGLQAPAVRIKIVPTPDGVVKGFVITQFS